MGEPKPIGKNWFGYACGASYVQYDDALAETQYEGRTADDAYDSQDKEIPRRTSHLSSKDFYREVAASLPFEFDLGVETSGRESERYFRGD